jgi:hypothetical protein
MKRSARNVVRQSPASRPLPWIGVVLHQPSSALACLEQLTDYCNVNWNLMRNRPYSGKILLSRSSSPRASLYLPVPPTAGKWLRS